MIFNFGHFRHSRFDISTLLNDHSAQRSHFNAVSLSRFTGERVRGIAIYVSNGYMFPTKYIRLIRGFFTMRKRISWLVIGILTVLLLSGNASVSFAKDGCGPPTSQPKGDTKGGAGGDIVDRPDDTVDVSTYEGIILHPSGYAPIAVLQNGYYGYTAALLEKLKEPYAVHDLSLPGDTVHDHPILIIPSGGLFGLEGSLLVKQRLAEYVANGGTIICFTQQHGYEFSALPTGKLEGFGWREDQSCWRGGAYIPIKHPIFAGQATISLDANIDGYFTQWPEDATILLRRTKNAMPVILVYPYGKGKVIATTLYSDQGFVTDHIAEDELNLIRDLLTWLKSSAGTITESEKDSDTGVQISLPIVNNSEVIAKKSKVTILNPDNTPYQVHNLVLPTSLSSGQTTILNFQQAIPPNLGIYRINYTLQNENNTPIQEEIKGGIFSVYKKLDVTSETKSLTFAVQSELETYPRGSDINFNFIVWNHSEATRTVTLEFSFFFNPTRKKETLIVPPKDKTTYVYTLHNVTQPRDRLIVHFYDENNHRIGSVDRSFFTQMASIVMSLKTDKEKYDREETVVYTLQIQNQTNISYDANIEVAVASTEDGQFYKKDFGLNLPAHGSTTQTATFTLPSAIAGGVCIFNVAGYSKGEKIGQAVTTFNIPKAVIIIDPILPFAFDYTNTAAFKITNAGALSLPSGSLAVTFKDSHDNLLWSETNTFGSITLAGSVTSNLNIPIPQIKLEEVYKLAYNLISEFTTLAGEIEIPCSNVIKLDFDKPSYRIRENLSITPTITNTGRFKENMQVITSVPDCNFIGTNSITLLPNDKGSITCNFTIPETTSAGGHPVQVTLMLGTSTISKVFNFSIPEAQPVFNINNLNYTAPAMGTFTLSNIGGVDETYNYIVRVIDEQNVTIFEKADSIKIKAGEITSPIEFNIPYQALDGGYTLAVLTTGTKGQIKNFYRPLYVSGIKAQLNINPEKKVYLTDEDVSLITQITNLDGNIEDATLTVKAFSSVEEWLAYTGVNDICDIALDGNYIWFATPGGVKKYDKITDKWQVYTSMDGLAGNDVTSVVVDSQFVWFGTRYNGVSRYDNVHNTWQTFTKADGLINNDVTAIAVGTDSVWIGSWDGATRYDKITGNWEIYRVADSQPGNFINDIAIDDRFIWFATYDGARRYDKRANSWQGYTTQNGLAHNQVCSIGADKNYIWFGAPDGLVSRYDTSNNLFNLFVTSANQPENRVNSIAIGTNSVWFATNKGITQYDKPDNLWKTFAAQDGLAGNYVKAAAIDNDTVWVGGKDGVSKYSPSTPWQTYTISDGLSDNEVTSLDIDNEIIWFGTVKGGLSKYNKTTNSFKNFTTKDGLLNNYVKAVAQDTAFIWSVTYDGLSSHERLDGSFQNFRYDVELLPYGGRGLELHSAIIDTDHIWFAGYGGMLKFDKTNSTFRRFTANDGLIDTHINTMVRDNDYVYFGTQKGVSRYNKLNQTFTNISQLNNIVIYSITVDNNIVWFGTEQGLYRYDKVKGTIIRFSKTDSGLLRDDVRVVASNDSFIWCATYDGVSRYDKVNETWRVYTTKDGLPSNLIWAIAIDSNYAYFATAHGIARLQIKGRLLYQKDIAINIDSPKSTFTTNIGKIGIPGKSFIEANLISKPGQVMDTSQNSFQVISEDVYLVISTDKPVYKPQEPITITATAYNRLSTSTAELSLVLKQEGDIMLSETFILPPNGSRTFTKTINSDNSFVIEGFLDNKKITEHITVMPPEAAVIITSPEIVGRDEFDLSIQLKNVSQVRVDTKAILKGGDVTEDLGTITLLANQATFIQRKCKFTQDGTITVSLSGDIEKVVSKKILFGEKVGVSVLPKQLYPEGVVVVPFSLINTGKFDSEVEVEFVLNKPEEGGQKAPSMVFQNTGLPSWCKSMPEIKIRGKGQIKGAPSIQGVVNYSPAYIPLANSIVIKQKFYVPEGTITTGEIIYDLTEGSYTLTHSSFFGNGSTSFRVAKDNVVDIDIDVQERVTELTGKQLPVNITVSNLGANEFIGELRIDTGFYQDKLPVNLSIGETKTFTFIGTPTVSEGTYTVLGEVLHNGGVILSRSKVFELIPQFTFEEIPAGLSFSVGEKGTITIKVKNNGSGEGMVFVQLKMFDIIDETKSIWIKSQGTGSTCFNINLPDDIEDRDYNGYLTLKTEGKEITEKILPFHVSGVKLSVNAGLDKILYSAGETATVTIAISNLNPQILPDMYAKVQFNGYEDMATFTLPTGTTTLTFQIPVSSNVSKLFYGIYLSSGRSIYLNTMDIYQMKDMINIYADKQVFNLGVTITLTAVSLIKGTLTITDIEGNERSCFIDGTTTIELKIPEVLTSGTYRFSYTFIPVTTGQLASSLVAKQVASNENIQDEFKFNIIGYQAKVLESKLDRIEYQPGDRLDLKLKIDSNESIAGLLKCWIVNPSWTAFSLVEKEATFTSGENLIGLTGTITAAYAGAYKLIYALYKVSNGSKNAPPANQVQSDEKGLLLASGAEIFDIILSPQITLITPATGKAGIPVTVKGSGFGSNEDIQIDFGASMTVSIATTDINGDFTGIFTTTQQPVDGTITITATGRSSGTSAITLFFLAPETPVNGVLHHINIIPATATIEARGTSSFTAEAFDQYGQKLTEITQFNWQVTGGNGTLIGSPGQTVVLATNDVVGTWALIASTSTVTGTSTVTVIHGSVTSISIAPAGTVSVEVMGSRTVTANAVNRFGHSIPASESGCTWGLISSIGGSITQGSDTTTFNAGSKTGTVEIAAEAEGKKSATTTITITPGPIEKLAFVGSTVRTLTVGIPGAMNVQTQDRFDNPSPGNATIVVNGNEQSRFSEVSSRAAWTTTGTFTKTGTSSLSFFFKQNGTTTPVIVTAAILGATTSATHSVTILLLGNSNSGIVMGDDGKTTVEVGSGSLTGEGYIEIDTSGTFTADMVIADDTNMGITRVEGTLRRFEVHNATITTVRIFIPYPDSNPDDGYIDGVTPPILASSLAIYHWVGSGTAAKWEKVASSQVDPRNNVVYSDVSGFSFYSLMSVVGFERNLERALVYPNPYYDGKHSCIYFDRLSQDSIIQIFTIAGELVNEIRADSSRMGWNARNSAGEKVASGIYIYLITDPAGNKKAGKFGVIK